MNNRQLLLSIASALLLQTSALGADLGSLTLADAIAQAIRTNLSTALAKAATDEARGLALQSAAALLPKITGSVSQTRTFKTNLEALGFTGGPFPPLIGPYNTFDARFSLVQSLLDVNAIWKTAASRANRRAALLEETLARQQVATAAALAFIEAQRAGRSVSAAQADVKLAQSLLKLAQDQRRAGVSTGVDVARAETNTAQEQLRLIRAQVDAQQAEIRLKRVVGLPLTVPVTLVDLPRPVNAPLPAEDQVVAQATHDRVELQIAKETTAGAQDSTRAARAENLPTIKAIADYGFSGTTPNNTARTGSFGGRLDLPIFAGGEIYGKTLEATARQREAEARLKDIDVQIEEDAILSLQTQTAEITETQTADQAVSLAQKELKMAKDRFAAGIGDNIQLLSAQTALDRALDDQLEAVARYDVARVNLATALGRIEDFK
jgi:outer membrane protein